MLVHSFITLLAYESANIFRDVIIFNNFSFILESYCLNYSLQQMSSMELFFHLMYIVYSSTTTGLLYNKNQFAPFCEFLRCSFVFFYSLNGLLVVKNVLTWAESVRLIEERQLVEHNNFILMFVQILFFISALIWGFISTIKKTAHSWQKAKLINKYDWRRSTFVVIHARISKQSIFHFFTTIWKWLVKKECKTSRLV